MLEHAEIRGGCRGGIPNSTNGVSTGGPQSSGALGEMMAYSKCMRSHGISDFLARLRTQVGLAAVSVSLAMVRTTISTTATRGTRAANKACQRLLPDAGQIPAPSAKLLAEELTDGRLYAQPRCTDFPDPDNAGRYV